MNNDSSIKGLELSRRYYRECVLPILKERVSEVVPSIAAGLLGFGSEVLGNDDLHSRDHDWGPRLVLFVPEEMRGEVSEKIAAVLQKEVPEDFLGFKTRFMHEKCLAIGITSPERFVELSMGVTLPFDLLDFLVVPEQRLLECVSGEIFEDRFGKITQIRNELHYFPFEVWTYRTAYALEALSWDYDLIADCAKRNTPLGMQLCLAKTVERVVKLTFLVCRRYCPSYAKWIQTELQKIDQVSAEYIQNLQASFASTTYQEAIRCLEFALSELYQLMKLHWSLPKVAPRKQARFFQPIATQEIARMLLDSLQGPLKELKTPFAEAPYGGVDQWCTHQDFLIETECFSEFKSYYKNPKKAPSRDPWETFI